MLNCQDAIHGDLGLVNAGDSVIALSYSGETAELLALLPHLKRRQIRLIAITGKPASTLGKAADCVIDIHVSREACPLNLAPTSSTTNTLVIGDALAMVLLEARGFTKEHFAELHPGGSLGSGLVDAGRGHHANRRRFCRRSARSVCHGSDFSNDLRPRRGGHRS